MTTNTPDVELAALVAVVRGTGPAPRKPDLAEEAAALADRLRRDGFDLTDEQIGAVAIRLSDTIGALMRSGMVTDEMGPQGAVGAAAMLGLYLYRDSAGLAGGGGQE